MTKELRNLLSTVPKGVQEAVAAIVRTIFAQPDREQVAAQLHRVIEQLHDRFPEAAKLLEEAGCDVTAFASLPPEHWRHAC